MFSRAILYFYEKIESQYRIMQYQGSTGAPHKGINLALQKAAVYATAHEDIRPPGKRQTNPHIRAKGVLT